MLSGRREELDRLCGAVDTVRPVVVRAPAGMGKTALLRELLRVRPGVVGQSLPALTHRSYHPLLHAFGWPPAATDVRSMVGRVRSQLAPQSVLVIEDVQWADLDTFHVLAELAAEHSVVLSVRPGGDEAAVAMVEACSGETLDLGPLTPTALADVLRTHASSLAKGELAWVSEHAVGNPLVALALVDHLAHVEPSSRTPSVTRGVAALAAVVEDLSSPDQELLALLSIAPGPLPADHLPAVDELVRRGLVSVGPEGVRAASQLLAELAWSTTSAEQRTELHGRLADSDDLTPVEQAGHLLRSGRLGPAFECASAAAAGPLSRTEQAEALRVALEAGGELQGTGDPSMPSDRELQRLRVAAGAALNDCARFEDAAEVLAPDLESDAPLDAATALELLRCATGLGRREHSDRVAARVPDVLDADGLEASRVVALRRLLGQRDGPDLAALAASELDGAAGPAQRSHAAFLRALSSRTDPADMLDWMEVAHREARSSSRRASEFEAARNLVMVRVGLGQHDEGRALARECAARAEAEGATNWAIEFRTHEVISLFQGRTAHDDALGWLSWVRTAPVRLETRAMAASILATLLADRGAAERSAAVLEPWLDPVALDGYEPMVAAVIVWAAAQRAWLLGEHEATIGFGRWVTDHLPTGFPSVAGTQVVWRWAEYEAGAELSSPDPQGGMTPCAALEADGIRLLAGGRPAEAAERFGEAHDAWAALLWRCALRCRWARGVALAEAGSAREAARVLSRLDAELDAADVPALRPRVRAALRSVAGGRASVPRNGAVGELSGRQREVLELVADGLTSAQIGRRLGLSTDTVNSHVRAAMRKLGASSRAEAASSLGRQAP